VLPAELTDPRLDLGVGLVGAAAGSVRMIGQRAQPAGLVPLGKRVHPHLLRHSWMTEMIRNGMSPIQLSIIAGASMQVIQEH
jgi:site-specific recombinase XerD